MASSFLSDAGGFTPLPDDLVKRYDFVTAYVWGVVWRYCQMENGNCTASHETIAKRAGMSRRSLIDKLDTLIKDGYIEDLTPSLKNKPHTYCVKAGESKIKSTMQNLHSESAEDAQSNGSTMQNIHSDYAENAQPTMQNLHLKKDSKETIQETTLPKGKGGKPPVADKPAIDKSLLEPDTPETRLLFAKINQNRQANGRGPAKRFKSIEQKEKCIKAAQRLGYDKFSEGIKTALESGITEIDRLVNWVAKWGLLPQNGTQSAYPRGQPATGPPAVDLKAAFDRRRKH